MSKFQLSTSTLDLLVRTLELSSPILSIVALRSFASEVRELRDAGLISPAGHEATALDGDHWDESISLQWSAEEGKLGYFSESRGWITADGQEVSLFAVDVPKVIAELTGDLGLPLRRAAAQLVPDHVWEAGPGRVGHRPKRLPILFGRRLGDRHIWEQLKEAARDRPASGRRILLTTTPSQLLPAGGLPQFAIIPIAGILASCGSLRIDSETISAAIDEVPRSEAKGPVWLSADGKLLYFFGEEFHFIKGIRQRDILRLLYKHYLEGERWLSSDTIVGALDLDPKTRIRDIFKRHPAWGRALTERRGMCGFCVPEQ